MNENECTVAPVANTSFGAYRKGIVPKSAVNHFLLADSHVPDPQIPDRATSLFRQLHILTALRIPVPSMAGVRTLKTLPI